MALHLIHWTFKCPNVSKQTQAQQWLAQKAWFPFLLLLSVLFTRSFLHKCFFCLSLVRLALSSCLAYPEFQPSPWCCRSCHFCTSHANKKSLCQLTKQTLTPLLNAPPHLLDVLMFSAYFLILPVTCSISSVSIFHVKLLTLERGDPAPASRWKSTERFWRANLRHSFLLPSRFSSTRGFNENRAVWERTARFSGPPPSRVSFFYSGTSL